VFTRYRLRRVSTNSLTVESGTVGALQSVLSFQHARVAKSADAKDLKSFFRQRKCGFNSRPGHHNISLILSNLAEYRIDPYVVLLIVLGAKHDMLAVYRRHKSQCKYSSVRS
jgi:hypothetical protein